MGTKTYYYLVESARVDGKPQIVSQQYLGSAEESGWSSPSTAHTEAATRPPSAPRRLLLARGHPARQRHPGRASPFPGWADRYAMILRVEPVGLDYPLIAAIDRTRRIAAGTLARVLRQRPTESCERDLSAEWSRLLAEDARLLPEGWYRPPPAGVSILIGQPPEYNRLRYVSLRHPSVWPGNARLGDDCLVYGYASPVDRDTMMIGDLGVTLYGGVEPEIWTHLGICLDITARVAEFAEVGMELRELYAYATRLMTEAAVVNETFSTTDASGGLDVGHTIPWSYRSSSPARPVLALASDDPATVAEAISRARLFINAVQRERIQPTMGLTIEPRMSCPGLPLVSFHVVVTFCRGVKVVHAYFAELFALFGMAARLPRNVLNPPGRDA